MNLSGLFEETRNILEQMVADMSYEEIEKIKEKYKRMENEQ